MIEITDVGDVVDVGDVGDVVDVVAPLQVATVSSNEDTTVERTDVPFPQALTSFTQPAPRRRQEVFQPNSTISYLDVTEILKTAYNFDESIEATSLDILALYLKGQKIIYTESKTFCEKQLNLLMLPAIFIAAVCSILNFILKEIPYGTIIISCMNAFNSFLLSLISYLKLDGKAEAHKASAYKFQKLESLCEFHSGKYLFFKESVNVLTFIEKVEKEVMEIRESNQFIVPQRIRERFPRIYATNVFALVKQVQNDEILVINRLKTSVQKLHLAFQQKKETSERLGALQVELEEVKHALQEGVCDQRPEKWILMMEAERSQVQQQIEKVSNELQKTMVLIDQCEIEKNNAFASTVKHRERYLDLAKTFQDDVNDSLINWYCTDLLSVS